MEVQNISGYEFHPSLDVKYLNTLYESNIGYAIDLFDIYVLTIREELTKIRKVADAGDWETLRFQVHKIKPNFSMVGLTWITTKLETMESLLRNNENLDTLPALLGEIVEEVNGFFPIIEKELQNMQSFMTGGASVN